MLIKLENIAKNTIVVNVTEIALLCYFIRMLQKISKQYDSYIPKIVEKYENIKDDIRHITYTINADLEIVVNAKWSGLFEYTLCVAK